MLFQSHGFESGANAIGHLVVSDGTCGIGSKAYTNEDLDSTIADAFAR